MLFGSYPGIAAKLLKIVISGQLVMTYHAVRNAGSVDVWVAEATDADGTVFLAIFVGKQAKSRAEEYAAWKNGSAGAEEHDAKQDRDVA